MESWLGDILGTFSESGSELSLGGSIIGIAAALAMGIMIAATYIKSSGGAQSRSLILTLLILPAITGIVIMLVGSNVARAFSMAGVFSLVRFRSQPGDPGDIAYIFLSAAAGLAAGLGYNGYGLIFTAIICAALLIYAKAGFGGRKGNARSLRITVPENLNFNGAFDDILDKYSEKYSLVRIRTVDLGTLYELSYIVSMSRGAGEKEFIDELRCRNGNLNITLSLREDA